MPSFYPSMVSLWVSDSFERKDMERSLLAQLLVNLSKGHDNLINRSQLIEGYVSIFNGNPYKYKSQMCSIRISIVTPYISFFCQA